MQIRLDQLAAHLQKGLRPLYTLWGDEPLLAQEAGDAIRTAARTAGHTERQVHTVTGAYFNWSGLLGAAQALSLFADKQVIEIRIPSGKPGKEGSEALQRYCETLSPDVVTLVQLPRLDRQQQACPSASIRSSARPCRSGSRSGWRRRASGCSPASPASRRWPFLPTGSRATCWRPTRRSRSWRCSIPAGS
jgi:DNA polymerase III delta subunit